MKRSGNRSITFNHIFDNLDELKKKESLKMYEHYHKKEFCYRQVYKHYKKMHLGTNLTGISLTIVEPLLVEQH